MLDLSFWNGRMWMFQGYFCSPWQQADIVAFFTRGRHLHASADTQVTAVVTCEAAGPWGLISTIEGIMAQQAEKSVTGFLAFCTARCKGEPVPEYASDVEFIDEFLDAAETLSIASSGDLGGWYFHLSYLQSCLQPLCPSECDTGLFVHGCMVHMQTLPQCADY